MMIVYSVLSPIIGAIYYLLEFYKWIMIIAIFLSWLNPDPYNPIVRLIYSLTEPVLYRIRRIIRLRIGMLDLTPIIFFIMIQIIQNLLNTLIYHMKF